MSANDSLHLLVNLPPTFFTHPQLQPYFDRLRRFASVRQRSHDTLEQILPELPWTEALLMWAWPPLDETALAQAPRLHFVSQLNTVQTTARACLKRGIALSEARHCWSPAVAEMALGLILSGLRKLSDYHTAMRHGQETWTANFPADIDPLERELTGRPVGIVGFGGIGRRLAELLAPFHGELRVYDPYLPEEVIRQHGATPAMLHELIENSDVVVLAAANNPEARHLIGRREIAAFRPHSLLVNVGRSMLVDTPALVKRLECGDLIAMLDVFDREPLELESPLRKLPNAYLTPHRAGGLLVSVERALTMLIEDLEAHLAGRPRHYAVDESMLPCFSG